MKLNFLSSICLALLLATANAIAAENRKTGDAGKKQFDVTITSSREDSTTALGFTFVPANEPINDEEEEKAKKGELSFDESPFEFDFSFSVYQSRVEASDRTYNFHVGGDYTIDGTYIFGLAMEAGRSSMDQVTTTQPIVTGGLQTENATFKLSLGWLHFEQAQSASGQVATSSADVFKFNQRVVKGSVDWDLNKQWSLYLAVTRYLADSDLSNRVNPNSTSSRFLARRDGPLNGSVGTLASAERRVGVTYLFSQKWSYEVMWIQTVEHLSNSPSTDTSFTTKWKLTPKVNLGAGLGLERSVDSTSGYGLISMSYDF